MIQREKKELEELVKKINPLVNIVFMNPKDLVFEENTKVNCFYCAKYGANWKCPPNLPNIDYKKMYGEFDEGAFVYVSYSIENEVNFNQIRNESSVVIHKTLLLIEKWMWNHNKANSLSFGAGSCKLCREGCGKEKCNNPSIARSPLEATGVNVQKSAHKYGIEVKFPADKLLKRVGLIVWQNERNQE